MYSLKYVDDSRRKGYLDDFCGTEFDMVALGYRFSLTLRWYFFFIVSYKLSDKYNE
jgi:hypothetical protein